MKRIPDRRRLLVLCVLLVGLAIAVALVYGGREDRPDERWLHGIWEIDQAACEQHAADMPAEMRAAAIVQAKRWQGATLHIESGSWVVRRKGTEQRQSWSVAFWSPQHLLIRFGDGEEAGAIIPTPDAVAWDTAEGRLCWRRVVARPDE